MATATRQQQLPRMTRLEIFGHYCTRGKKSTRQSRTLDGQTRRAIGCTARYLRPRVSTTGIRATAFSRGRECSGRTSACLPSFQRFLFVYIYLFNLCIGDVFLFYFAFGCFYFFLLLPHSHHNTKALVTTSFSPPLHFGHLLRPCTLFIIYNSLGLFLRAS